MIKRLYVNNFRSLVGFEARFDSFGVLCGPNGAGKSSVFDALSLVRDFAAGDILLPGAGASRLLSAGVGARDLRELEFTKWVDSRTQQFELTIRAWENDYDYTVHLHQDLFDRPQVVHERAACNGRELFIRDRESMRFVRNDGSPGEFPLDLRQSALGAFQPGASSGYLDIIGLRLAIERISIIRPDPRVMEGVSDEEVRHPDLQLARLTSWYRTLVQDQERSDGLRDSLRAVWPDFRAFKLSDVGARSKSLSLRFGGDRGGAVCELDFSQLSDGEKALVALYMVREALHSGEIKTVLIDEPDNFVGLPELQPWVLSLREILDEERQAILISHHPEILSSAGEENGLYLWRDSHTSPTRIGPLKVPEGLTPGEAIARGWARA